MLFCDREYYECCSSLPTARPDSWEIMLSLCRCAVEHDGWLLAAFFLPVEVKREYVLGPHWGVKAPFIRVSYTFWSVTTAQCRGITEGGHHQWLLPLRMNSASRLMFYGLAGEDALSGAEAGCAEELFDRINVQLPDLSSE